MLQHHRSGMLAHKLRLALTTASIALGVAFLAGTLILTDTMHKAFDQLFGKVSAGTDAVVRTAGVVRRRDRRRHQPPVPASVLSTVNGVAGVRAAEGIVCGYALLTDNAGKAILTSGGAPTTGRQLPADVGLRGDVKLRSGHAPTGPDQVAIDAPVGRQAPHRARLDDQDPVPRADAGRSPSSEPSTFGGEKNLGGTHHRVLRHRHRATGARHARAFDQIDVAGRARRQPGGADRAAQRRRCPPAPRR